ncbi:uncharacterized protein [Oscarella lobularis]|uniref:uncharacterized protein n=1 Tax=Oscarella lobularis TaxID=121494 RepID=UPI003313AC12
MWSACCPCFRTKQTSNGLYEPLLLEKEREAVNDLLEFLQKTEGEANITDERLQALCTLTYSENVDLQRSAALCFSEISEKLTTPIDESILEPILSLIQSQDTEVQSAASVALSNFALIGPVANKEVIVRCGALRPLVALLSSSNVDVQCNACGCMTTLATSETTKRMIVVEGAVGPLLRLARSRDPRVQRNATGTLLNLTHLDVNRFELARFGAIPVFIGLLQSRDCDVQYYCAAALSNMAVHAEHRVLMTQIGGGDVVRYLISLLSIGIDKVKCQSCLALRNLASDGSTQMQIVEAGGLKAIHPLLNATDVECQTAAIAALRNLSIHKDNAVAIVRENFLADFCVLLGNDNEPEIQCHTAGTLRNLATEDLKDSILNSGCLKTLATVLLSANESSIVQSEASAALAVLAANVKCQEAIVGFHDGRFIQVVMEMAMNHGSEDVRYNCLGIIGHLALNVNTHKTLLSCRPSVLDVIDVFLKSSEISHVHIGMWATCHLSEGAEETKTLIKQAKGFEMILKWSGDDAVPEVRQLAETIIKNIK